MEDKLVCEISGLVSINDKLVCEVFVQEFIKKLLCEVSLQIRVDQLQVGVWTL